MTVDTEILNARESRVQTINSLRNENPLIIIHANIPGENKNNPWQKIIVNTFAKLCETLYHTKPKRHHSKDGMFISLCVNQSPTRIKKTMIYLEENHPLGRLVDLDVHTSEGQLSRAEFNQPQRPCFICDKAANICRRENNHTKQELQDYIEKTVKNFLVKALAIEATNALRREVYTYPCFGLVSHKNTGIHQDMNITHFLSAIDILQEAFETYVAFGVHKGFNLKTLREQGKLFELTMLKTIGCNTHKGAHYLFGLVLPIYVKTLIEGHDIPTFKKELKASAKALENDDFSNKIPPKTIGEKAYKAHHIRGIRGEMSEGLPSIFSWYPNQAFNDTEKLIAIMATLDDTTLLKEDKNLLDEVKQCMQNLLKDNFASPQEKERCLNKKISPGGAADMLSLVYFFERSDYLFLE